MEKSERVLKALSDHSQSSDYKYERLYRYLFSEEMFAVAYQRIYAKQGNMTPALTGKTIDEMSLERIERLIGVLKGRKLPTPPCTQSVHTEEERQETSARYSLIRGQIGAGGS